MFAVGEVLLVVAVVHAPADRQAHLPAFFFVLGIVAVIVLYLIVLTTLHVFGG